MSALSWNNPFGSRIPTVPALDGAFRPNQRLDLCPMLDRTLSMPDDVCVDAAGHPIVSTANRLVRVTGSWFAPLHQVIREFDGPAGAMTQSAEDDSLLVVVDGEKIIGVGGAVDGLAINEIEGRPLRCVTAIAMMPERRLAICEGSASNRLENWTKDLLERGATGRVTIVDLDSRRATPVAENLAWPQGVTFDGGHAGGLIVAESWRHRLLHFQRDARGGWSRPRAAVLDDLPAYPGRIAPSAVGGFWISFFAVRSQLVEYVIAHQKFCRRMIDEIDREYWIAPSLASTDDPWEAMQLGAIKYGGVKKPWAPPRSYGLVARVDSEFRVVESLHSRHDCKRHGVTGLRQWNGTLLIASKGHGNLIEHTEGQP
jgi:hypothetical protein